MSEKQSEKNIFFLYELAHIDAYERFLNENQKVRKEGYLIVPLGLEIEYALAKKGIPFRSGREYRPLDTDRFLLSEEWMERLTGPKWKWFQYRDVPLSQMFFVPIRHYILYLLYYATILENLLVRHSTVHRLIVFPPSHSLHSVPLQSASPIRQQPLLRQQLAAVVACARLVGEQHGVEVVISRRPPTHEKYMRFHGFVFALKRIGLELGIDLYNIFITLFVPRGTPRILASDYWRNIAPVMLQLPQGELMLFDRGEVFKAGFRNLFRSRVRLYNFGSFPIRDRKDIRRETERLFKEQWHTLLADDFSEYSSGSFSLRPLVIEAFEEIIENVVPQALRDIDGAYAMMKALTPEIVFLRASISLQTHFFILAHVARASGIPSLELQHGLEDLSPSSLSSKWHSAEYIAVYGQLVQDEFVALGFPRERFPIVGSPRFDVYEKEKHTENRDHLTDRKGISVLCVGTAVGVESFYDDYDLEDYYKAIAQAFEKTPNSSVVIKLRAGSSKDSFYCSVIDRIFARVPHTIAQNESPSELFASTDVVLSYYSTFVLEALQFKKPTIVFSPYPYEKQMINFHFTRYAEEGSLLIADTQEELEDALVSLSTDTARRNRLAHNVEKVLAAFYSFDGKASERIVRLIERLSRNTRSSHQK